MQITRRVALRGAAAVAAVSAVPGVAVAQGNDAYLMALYRRWKTRRKQVNDYIGNSDPDVSNEEYNALCGPVLDMEYEIATTPAQTLRGIAAKFRAYVVIEGRPSAFLDQEIDHLYWYDREKAYVASIYRDLERLVGEG